MTTEAIIETNPERAAAHQRMVEAVLFASERPLSVDELAERLPEGANVEEHLSELTEKYAVAGVNLVQVAGKYMFRTAEDLSFLLRREVDEPRKLSRAAVETLSIIAYHQPVTRAEIEEIRGVSISKGTLDVLMEAEWVRMMGRKRTPGRPVTYGTTENFLIHFGIESIKDLPGLQELKAAGLLDSVDVALDKMGGVPSRRSDSQEDDAQIDLEEAIAASERQVTDERNQHRHSAVSDMSQDISEDGNRENTDG
ncbi:segregation and condensation protein B [Kordiimonas sediminis]|uniref:Segregation and condensation protein B n=1 Tax=Kordiimonas sediminis TaxID=1735581 RepID=A0A919E8Z1_9PROT|nr:SMC-Scp complex subunit ScpB [Kordiimonas sediminis]GHF26002.1 segregation and condensation protein B [Kordiimonas sediminis]